MQYGVVESLIIFNFVKLKKSLVKNDRQWFKSVEKKQTELDENRNQKAVQKSGIEARLDKQTRGKVRQTLLLTTLVQTAPENKQVRLM